MLVSKAVLSGSDDGRPIKLATTATPGDLIHTGASESKIIHEVWLWAFNSSTSDQKLTVEFGGVTSPDDTIEQNITPEDGLVIVCPGLVLLGNSTAKLIRAFAETTNLIMITGYVNIISQG